MTVFLRHGGLQHILRIVRREVAGEAQLVSYSTDDDEINQEGPAA